MPTLENQSRQLLSSMRLQQWIKNLFLFAALVFSGYLFKVHDILLTVIGFFAFSFLSSATYLFNDVVDIENDKIHPIKSKRPIASGTLSSQTAMMAAAALAILSLVVGFLLRREFGIVLATYLALNVSYSLKLKHIVILDAMSIAGGFVLRVVAGAVLIQVPTSEWLIICTILISLFLGFSKRRTELVSLDEQANHHRSVLAQYSPRFLDQMIGIVTSSTVMSYALYTISDETVRKFGTKNLIYTVPFVLYGIFRYLYLVDKKAEGVDPAKTILTDISLLVNVVLWVIAASLIIYRK